MAKIGNRSGPEPADVYVGQAVRARRRELGMSQNELAEACGITFQQVQKYERGSNRISVSRLVMLAFALKCAPSDLLAIVQQTQSRAGHGLNVWAETVTRLADVPHGFAFARGLTLLTPDQVRIVQEIVAEYNRLNALLPERKPKAA